MSCFLFKITKFFKTLMQFYDCVLYVEKFIHAIFLKFENLKNTQFNIQTTLTCVTDSDSSVLTLSFYPFVIVVYYLFILAPKIKLFF